jgi:hypothetical protein
MELQTISSYSDLLSKLAIARTFIKAHPIKKDGENTYSKYNYFTPEYVEKLVSDACTEANILCIFNLECDVFGYFGEVLTYDLETGEKIRTVIRTEKPNITATNATQQMGGMNTYTKRYALMSLFGIEDNTIDFDSDEHAKKSASSPATQTAKPADDRAWLNKTKSDKVTLTDEWTKAVEALKNKTHTLAQIEKKYKISKENKQELQNL